MRYFLEVQYDGTSYHGWQIQPNAISVQQVIEEKLSMLLGAHTGIMASGRTDTGVHCSQQFAHFDTDNNAMIPQLVFKLNSVLPSDISIMSLRAVEGEAHARFDATKRSYTYFIHTAKTPFLRHYSYRFFKSLDFERMNEACEILKEFKDFKAFSKKHTDVKTHLCDIFNAEWKQPETGKAEFHITANRFLRGMVRLIVGGMLDVGTGKMDLNAFRKAIEAQERGVFRNVAPAHGLFLTKVEYPASIFRPTPPAHQSI